MSDIPSESFKELKDVKGDKAPPSPLHAISSVGQRQRQSLNYIPRVSLLSQGTPEIEDYNALRNPVFAAIDQNLFDIHIVMWTQGKFRVDNVNIAIIPLSRLGDINRGRQRSRCTEFRLICMRT